MNVSPINNNCTFKSNSYKLYGIKLSERLPVSFNPVKNITNNLLKKVVILSHKYQYPIIEALKNYTSVVQIPHKKDITTDALEIKKYDAKKYIVILHGLSNNVTNLQDLYKSVIYNTDYAVLAPEYTDICYPHRNRKTLSTKTIVDDATASVNYLEKKGISQKDIIIAGHSFGGYIAAMIAKKFPDIGKLILISPADSFRYKADHLGTNKNSFIPEYARKMATKFKFVQNKLGHLYEINKLLKSVQCPVDIIYSKGDKVTSEDSMLNITSACTNLHKIYELDDNVHRMTASKIKIVTEILNNED